MNTLKPGLYINWGRLAKLAGVILVSVVIVVHIVQVYLIPNLNMTGSHDGHTGWWSYLTTLCQTYSLCGLWYWFFVSERIPVFKSFLGPNSGQD